MQIKNKQRLFLLGKVILFLLTYIVLGFSTGIIAQNIFKGDRFYDQLPFDLLNYAITIFVLLLFVKIIDKENIVSGVGLSLKNHIKEFFSGGIAGVICIVIGFFIVIKLNFKQVEFSSYWIEKADYFLIGTLITMCSVIMEEVIFRGYILRKLYEKFPLIVSIVLSSIPFTLFHLLNPNITFWGVSTTFLAGILLGILYLTTKNIWLACGFHFSWNYMQVLLGFNVSGGGRMPSILSLNFEEMNAFNGGYYGLEGSYLCTIILIILIIAYGRNMFKK